MISNYGNCISNRLPLKSKVNNYPPAGIFDKRKINIAQRLLKTVGNCGFFICHDCGIVQNKYGLMPLVKAVNIKCLKQEHCQKFAVFLKKPFLIS